MREKLLSFFVLLLLLGSGLCAAPGEGNRLAYLNEFCNPYYVGLGTPKLVTPQWIGEAGVEAAVVLSIDDMSDPGRYETFLRPILDRLKAVDGRAPVSIITTHVDPQHPQLQAWLKEGLSIEAHTYDHPCPCLQGKDLDRAKATFDRCVDLLWNIPNTEPVAFRMPCCDSMNSASPRFITEIFGRTTPQGNFLRLDSSVFMLFTPDDPFLLREQVFDDDGRQRFTKYVPRNRDFVNFIEDYPYPYVIDRLCWEIPAAIPDDWQGLNLQGAYHAKTLEDMKIAIDATVIKQGVFTLTFHPGAWIHNHQVVELIDHAVRGRAGKVKFLNFREIHGRLTKNLLGGHPLRAEDGQDNGVRLLDVNRDGYMDIVIGNDESRQTRIWSSSTGKWTASGFPVKLVTVDKEGNRKEAGVQFGVLRADGFPSLVVRNEETAGVWHFDGQRWAEDPRGLTGLAAEGPVSTSLGGYDCGVRLRDLDGDGSCELLLGNPRQSAVFRWKGKQGGWERLPFELPEETTIVDAQGRDAGLRFVDVDVDTHPDLVFSDARRYGVYRFTSMASGWSQTIMSGQRGNEDEPPAIVRADGANNGVWFKQNHMWLQNEETGGKLPHQVDRRHFTDLLGTDRNPPPRSPVESLHSFEVLSGFKVELVAAEPLVMDPADIAWGPDGKAWVVEYADYPLGLDDRGQPGGRIRFLEDADGDGRYDRSTVFLEPVAYPMGIMVWRNGVLVTAAPDIFYAEDTDGDGRADVRKTLFTGFGEGNQQHRVNHPRWGLDNWVHVANGDSGGTIRSLASGRTMSISGRDARFRPDEGLMDPQTGQTQFGTNRDDWGNWFGCNNSNPGWLYALADHYTRRNPHVAPPPGRVDVTADRTVYPVGRVISHCDLKHRPHAAWGKPGQWTSVASVMIYRDELFGPHFTGNLFVDDSVYNVIHRRILKAHGVTFRGERGPDEHESEFLASHDIWFRPSTVRTGPDGTLWVLDMYRFVIEHPEWIDDELEKTLDLRAGHDRGRIYRVYPVDKEPRPIPRLDRLDTARLVAALDSPSGWQRDLAHQMLLWRADLRAIQPLEEMVIGSKRALARLHALCVLDGLEALRVDIVVRALSDRHPGVRRHAVRVSEPLLGANPKLGEALLKLADDPDTHVLMQLGYSLGEWDDPRAGRMLGRMAARHLGDRYLTAAVLSSATPHVGEMIAAVVADSGRLADRAPLLSTLMNLAVGLENREVVAPVLEAITAESTPGFASWQYESMAKLLDGLGRRNLNLRKLAAGAPPRLQRALEQSAQLFDAARHTAAAPDAALAHRLAALRILGRGPDREKEDRDFLAGLLAPQSPIEVQLAAVETMGRLRRKEIPELLLRDWTRHGPKLNSAIIDVLLSRREWTSSLLEHTERQPELAAVVSTARREQLLRHPAESIRRRAEALLGRPATNEDIQAALKKCAPVVDMEGDPLRGREVFVEAKCLDCHQLDGLGNEIAADLRTLLDKSPEALLVALVDPNRAVEDKYTEYAAVSSDGSIRSGVLVEETTSSITLADAGGKKHVILRRDLLELVNSGRSGMPERLEETLSLQQMADLFAFIANCGAPPREVTGNRPAIVASDPDGSFHLRAGVCEIYAPGVRMGGGSDYLIWFYEGPKDHVVWTVDVARSGRYEVWIEWSQIDEYAGNAIAVEVEGDSERVTGKLPSTGGWGRYQRKKLGELQLQAGRRRLRLRTDGPALKELSDLRGIDLVPVHRRES